MKLSKYLSTKEKLKKPNSTQKKLPPFSTSKMVASQTNSSIFIKPFDSQMELKLIDEQKFLTNIKRDKTNKFFSKLNESPIPRNYNLLASEINSSEKFHELKQLAIKQFSSKNRYQVLETIQRMIDLFTLKEDINGMLKSFALMGKISLFLKDFPSTIQSFIMVKKIATPLDRKEELLHCFKHLGICFHMLGKHELALKCFKKQLHLAWKVSNVGEELDAYDHMGLEYYYMEDMDRASYYHDRMMRAKSECKNAISRADDNYKETGFVKNQITRNVILKGLRELSLSHPIISSDKFKFKASDFVGSTSRNAREFNFNFNKYEEELSIHDLPTPRGQSIPSTTMLMPYFSEEDLSKCRNRKMEEKQLNWRSCLPVQAYIKRQIKKVGMSENIEKIRKMNLNQWLKFRLGPKFPIKDNKINWAELKKNSKHHSILRPTFSFFLTHSSTNRTPKYKNFDYTGSRNLIKLLQNC